jgi:hypothetical protein
MARAITITDPTFEAKPSRNALERFFLGLIRDERDLPFIWLALQMTSVLIPAGVALFFLPRFFGGEASWIHWAVAAVLYWALLYGVFVDRYMLMLHNTSHRPLFKRSLGWMNKWIPWVIGPFTGQTPDTYYIHHITMHHSEGNLPKDLSSTMKYQRDSVFDWLRYFSRFFFLILFDMIRYQVKKKRWPLIRRMVLGELGFYAMCIGLSFVQWQAALIVFIIPFVVIRVLMMGGNWGQHAFVDPDEPNNDYKSSITCINARYNRRAFNDGYHISHHLVANRHWTDHPGELLENIDKYVENDAIVFEGIDFFMVWVFLMLKRYDTLFAHFVDLRDEPRPKEEVIALFKRRLVRFSPEQLAAYS